MVGNVRKGPGRLDQLGIAESGEDDVVRSRNGDGLDTKLGKAVDEAGEGVQGGGVERADALEVQDDPLLAPRVVHEHLLDPLSEPVGVHEEERSVESIDEQARLGAGRGIGVHLDPAAEARVIAEDRVVGTGDPVERRQQ